MIVPSSAASASLCCDQSNQSGSSSVTSRSTFVSTSVSTIAAQQFHNLVSRKMPVLRRRAANRLDEFFTARLAWSASRLGAANCDCVTFKSEIHLTSSSDPDLVAQTLRYGHL